MTKSINSILIFIFLFSFSSNSQEDTTFVQAHDYVDMDAHGNFDNWAVFPDGSNSYRQILMHYDLRCGSPNNPTWPGCSGWDYTTKISLLKENGLDDNEDPIFIHDQTLANVVTPYGTYMQPGNSQGTGFSPNWVHRYTYDVTDFAPLLKDSVLIRAFYGGWPQSGAGGCFNVTLNFEFIEGIPPRNVLDVKNLWSGNQSYANLQNLTDSNIFFSNDDLNSMLRVTVSGHGLNGEFTEGVNYHVEINDENIYTHELWRDDCGEVAIYPQGGTWIYNRANWCPGDKATTIEHELTDFINLNDNNSLSFKILKPNSVSWYNQSEGEGSASYIYDAQLFTYGEPNFNLDAVMEDIIAPSTKQEHFRFNPTCSNPIVKIKNQGSQNLTSVEIVYGFDNYNPNIYTWVGNLEFGQSEIVMLPPINWYSWDDDLSFYARVNSPNFNEDEYNVNDILYTNYEYVQEYPSKFAMYFKTNNFPNESSYELRDNFGNLIFEKTGMDANTLYRDTFELAPGCYKLQILDTGGSPYSNEDGLAWWANNDGSGYARLRSVPGGFFKYYEPDFGSELTDYFRIGEYSIDLKDHSFAPFFEVYPNPSKNYLNIDFEFVDKSNVNIFLLDITGQIIFDKRFYNSSSNSIKIDISNFPTGIYTCVLKTSADIFNKRVVVIK
ncbi:MAG: hypothetical protein CMP65_02145 [Flavobacteriales bacterium]|nr:hypothetical protein [Flavobacteriales bacterium]